MKLRMLLLVCAAFGVLVPVALGGGAPSIAFTPGSHDYGTIDSGTTASQTFVLKNTGGSATAALTVSVSGSSAFSKTADSCTGTSLGPKKQCSVTVRYAPTSAGSTDAGTLTASAKKQPGVATAALTGKSTAAPTCTSGSENFNEDTLGSQPTTFSGGTIDTAYGTDGGGVYPPQVGFSNNFLITGLGVNVFRLTFTNAVKSVQLNAESAVFADTHLTLTGYNASDTLIASQDVFEPAGNTTVPLSISYSTNSNPIKYFTIATNDPDNNGLYFSDIVWGCAT